jgi:hypothetical protein
MKRLICGLAAVALISAAPALAQGNAAPGTVKRSPPAASGTSGTASATTARGAHQHRQHGGAAENAKTNADTRDLNREELQRLGPPSSG